MTKDKTAIVLDFLTNELKQLNAGDRLPSTRKIQAACSVSQAVATRALDELQAMNLIEAKPQSGYYKTERKITQVHIVFLNKSEKSLFDPASFYYENLSRITMGLSSKGFSVNLHVVDSLEELPFYPLYAKKQQRLGRFPESVIITFSLKYAQLPCVRLMEEHGFRFIHWLPNFVEPCPNSIRIDDKELINAQVDLLYAKGHRRIAYLHHRHPVLWHRADSIRYEEFCRQIIEKNLPACPEYLVFYDQYSQDQEYCDQQIDHLFSLPAPPTALLLNHDLIAKDVFNALEKHALAPGRDVAVLGTNNRVFAPFMSPALSSVGFDLDAGIHYLQTRMSAAEWESAGAWFLPLRIAERKTT